MLSEFFTDDVLIPLLANLRARTAKERADREFHHRLHPQKQDRKHPLDRIFPPRKCWHRFRPRKRGLRSSLQLNAIAIERAIRYFRQYPRKKDAAWIGELHVFLQQLRNRVFGTDEFAFTRPKVRAEPKDDSGNHRALTIYPFEDRIISTLLTRYLRRFFDPLFSPSSFAFREPQREGCPSHHDAVEQLHRFRLLHQDKPLWVAECDIKGFFDCIHHDVVRTEFQNAISCAEKMNRKKFDPKATELFEAYLSSYAFTANVLEDAEPKLKSEKPTAFIKWPETELKQFFDAPREERIGIPQGGAISCLIANLVLDEADKVVQPKAKSRRSELFYARYCDDMIAASPDRKLLDRAFKRYLRLLNLRRLPVHQPCSVSGYSKSFWDVKSKSPYRWWGSRHESQCSPWIGFVGYQIRYDGVIRIRKNSIRKQHEKIIKESDAILWTLLLKGSRIPRPAVRVSARQAIFRLQQRLISSAVGRTKIHRPSVGFSSGLCWITGFKALRGKNFVVAQLRALDRQRGRQLARIKLALRGLTKPEKAQPTAKGLKKQYYGAPFSYSRQLA